MLLLQSALLNLGMIIITKTHRRISTIIVSVVSIQHPFSFWRLCFASFFWVSFVLIAVKNITIRRAKEQYKSTFCSNNRTAIYILSGSVSFLPSLHYVHNRANYRLFLLQVLFLIPNVAVHFLLKGFQSFNVKLMLCLGNDLRPPWDYDEYRPVLHSLRPCTLISD